MNKLIIIIIILTIITTIIIPLNNACIDLKSNKITFKEDDKINVNKIWETLKDFNNYYKWNNYIKLNYTKINNKQNNENENENDYNLIGFFEDSKYFPCGKYCSFLIDVSINLKYKEKVYGYFFFILILNFFIFYFLKKKEIKEKCVLLQIFLGI